MIIKDLHKLFSKIALVAIIGQVIGAGFVFDVQKAKADEGQPQNDPCTTAKINEIAINSLNQIEWVELYNSGSQCAIGSWKIKNETTSTLYGTVASNTSISTNGYYVMGKTPSVVLSKGDTLALTNSSDTIKDSIVFNQDLQANKTFGRITDGSANWRWTSATEGVANNQAPTKPVLSSPEDNTAINAHTETFSWNPSTDPEGDTVSYNFYYKKLSDSDYTSKSDVTSPVQLDAQKLAEAASYEWYVEAVDNYGAKNESEHRTLAIIPDAVNDYLKGSVTVEGKVTLSWTGYNDSDVAGFIVATASVTDPNREILDVTTEKTWKDPELLTTDSKIYYVTAANIDGDESMEASITVEKGKSYFDGSGSIPVANNLDLNLNTYVGYVTAENSQTTNNALPTNLKSVGQYWTVKTDPTNNDTKIIKMYFTQAELGASHIADPAKQIKGLYYLDPNTLAWGEYGTITKSETSDKTGYAWKIEVEVSHFTEFVAVAEKYTPAAPQNIKLNYSNNKLKISWDRVEGAIGYKVYIGLSKDSLQLVEGGEVDADVFEIEKNILTGKTYYVAIIAESYDLLLSPLSEIKEIVIAGVESSNIVLASETTTTTSTPSSSTTVQSQESETAPSVTPSEAQEPTQESTSSEETNSTNRVLVTVIILILAAGAGIGGYYGYLWWQDRSQDEPVKKPTVKPTSKTQSSKSKTKKGATTKRKSTRW